MRVLTDTGFTGRFGRFMVTIAGGNVWSQGLAFGFVSALMVNVLNDLPSTVCWASMLPILCESYAPRNFHVVLQALLVGVNPGTYLSIVSVCARQTRVWAAGFACSHGCHNPKHSSARSRD